jgi:hypothetical protein
MPIDVIDQLRTYLDYASGQTAEETLTSSPGRPSAPWYRRGPAMAVLAGVLVLAVGVPALLLVSDQPPPAVSELLDPLDVGVERVWPDSGFMGGPDDIAAAFAQQALGWTNVETVSDPEASPDGPVWTTIQSGENPDLEVLSVPIGGGLRVLMQVGSPGLTVGPADDGSGQRIGISRVAGSDSAVLHIRYVEPDRVEVVTATAADLERGQVDVDSDSPIGGIVAVYLDPDGEAMTAIGGHFGPFDTPLIPTETTLAVPESFPATRTEIGLGWEAVEIPTDVVALCHRAQIATETELIFWGGDQESCDYEVPTGDPGMAYNLDSATWRQLPASPLDPVVAPAGVWTGSEVIVCCGMTSRQAAAYDPADDSWRSLAESPLSGPFAESVWTGQEMIVVTQQGVAAYNPVEDTWRSISSPPEEIGRVNNVVWTGAEVVVWPVWPTGEVQRRVVRGQALDPASDTWRVLPDPPAWPAAPDMVATDDSLIIWGGLPANSGGSERAVGSQYDLDSGTWTPLPEALPEPDGCECNLGSQALSWTGEYLLVSPGWFSSGVDPTTPVLVAYHPETDTWILVADESPLAWGGETLIVGDRLVMVANDVLYASPPNWQPTGEPITPETWDN